MYGKQPRQGMSIKSTSVSPKAKSTASPTCVQYREPSGAGSGRAAPRPSPKAKSGY